MASIQWSSAVSCQYAWSPYLECRFAVGSEQTSFEGVGAAGIFSCPQDRWVAYLAQAVSGSAVCVPNRPVFSKVMGGGAVVFEMLSTEVPGTFTMRLRDSSNRARSAERVVSQGGRISSDLVGHDASYVRASQLDFGYPGLGLTVGGARYSASCALRYNYGPTSCI